MEAKGRTVGTPNAILQTMNYWIRAERKVNGTNQVLFLCRNRKGRFAPMGGTRCKVRLFESKQEADAVHARLAFAHSGLYDKLEVRSFE